MQTLRIHPQRVSWGPGAAQVIQMQADHQQYFKRHFTSDLVLEEPKKAIFIDDMQTEHGKFWQTEAIYLQHL